MIYISGLTLCHECSFSTRELNYPPNMIVSEARLLQSQWQLCRHTYVHSGLGGGGGGGR